MNILDDYKDNLANCPTNDCGAGINSYGTVARYDNTYDFVVVCSCPKCNTTWDLCRHCTGNFMYVLLSKHAVENHRKRIAKDLIEHAIKYVATPGKKKRKHPPKSSNFQLATISTPPTNAHYPVIEYCTASANNITTLLSPKDYQVFRVNVDHFIIDKMKPAQSPSDIFTSLTINLSMIAVSSQSSFQFLNIRRTCRFVNESAKSCSTSMSISLSKSSSAQYLYGSFWYSVCLLYFNSARFVQLAPNMVACFFTGSPKR
jgi:hypothetical protein